jgi:surface protein
MDLYLNLMPDLRNIVTEYFGDVIFIQAQDEVTFATAEEFKKSRAADCHFINFEITSTDHENHPNIPKSLLRCSGVPNIKTHTLAFMFQCSEFNGDISQWDVSYVTNMGAMFQCSKFNGDISQWDVSNVKDMRCMFTRSQFNRDLSKWNVSNVETMSCMFYKSKFNGGISQWDVSSVQDTRYMFAGSNIKKENVQLWNNFNRKGITQMF